MKKLLFYAGVFLLWIGAVQGMSLSVQAAPRVQQTGDVVTIVIDPGHGGKNEGTKENGALEKTMTMITAQAMYDELCKYDNVEVYLTRTSDVDLSLKERAEYADSVDADFMFSIHYNASLNHELYGSEVWVSLLPPYNAYGYQFGSVQMENMRDMGLFLRGVKTRPGDEGDYYGIIREAVNLDIPAVIIEHCHVDEERDIPFCDSTEDLEAFGRADALSVAKYFGLSSAELGVDYSSYSSGELQAASAGGFAARTTWDETEPDVCQLTLLEADYETRTLTLEVSAADYDSMLLYYSYSLDGGESFTPREPWPDCDVFTGTYSDTFTATLQVPMGATPEVIFRAYNPFDLYTESNTVSFGRAFLPESTKGTKEAVTVGQGLGSLGSAAGPETSGSAGEAEDHGEGAGEDASAAGGGKLPGTTTFRPDEPREETEGEGPSFMSFLIICLAIVILLLFIVLVSQAISDGKRRRKRQRRKLAGENSHQHR